MWPLEGKLSLGLVRYLVCSVPIIEDSLFHDPELSGAELFADLDRLRADDVLPGHLDAAVVLDVVG